ncbi:unnamed protein product [Macrosiphum euphorbiae]|uniref:RING-type domain-containing protein n=2 Tax=Macrosiphum euphorbiae TaxID=13131 RepID=A0AAV0X0X5_9HEMI|nr:unnamed protein product [Macrosiphum euphorbiae]
MVMAIALLPNQKLDEGFDEIRRMYRTEIQNYIGQNENENIHKFLEYYRRTWLTGIFAEMLSVSHQNRRTNNVLEISHRNLMTNMQNPNPSPWLFLENLITHVHGIMNDYRLAVDGIEVRQPRPRASIEQDKKITLGLTKLVQNRFSVAEFLGYTKHVTPNFGVERPNVHNEELRAQTVQPIIEPVLNNMMDNIELRAQTVQPIIEPVLNNMMDNIELRAQTAQPIIEPVLNNMMDNIELRAQTAQPIIEPVLNNMMDNIELRAQTAQPIIEPVLNNMMDNIEPRDRVILGYESPPAFFQGVLRHYNLPLLLPLPIYEEQDVMPYDVLHEFQEHNDEELDNEIVPYVVDNIEPLVWPTFEFEPQHQIINPINDFPHINIRRSNDEVENMREIVVCVACMSTGSNIVLRPCNHVCLCGECFEGLDRLVCPLCRAVITEIVVILE